MCDTPKVQCTGCEWVESDIAPHYAARADCPLHGDLAPPDETNAAEYVETAMRGRLDDIDELTKLSEGLDLHEADVKALDIGAEYDDHELQNVGEVMKRAHDRLTEMPLSIETTTTFEIVLGTGGPDDRLLFECDTYERGTPEQNYEIRRVLYRYSWSGSAEIELSEHYRDQAEQFARRVVPELAE